MTRTRKICLFAAQYFQFPFLNYREFLRERATADFLRAKDYKGSADHLDKTSSTSSSPMYYSGLAPMGFEVTAMGLDSSMDKNNGNVLPHPGMGHPAPPPGSHPSGTQTLQRRPHTPHMGHTHTPPHSATLGGQHGGPHGPHGHNMQSAPVGGHPSQLGHHPDPEGLDKKGNGKPEIDRKTKGKDIFWVKERKIDSPWMIFLLISSGT